MSPGFFNSWAIRLELKACNIVFTFLHYSRPMNIDLTSQAMALQQSQTQAKANIIMLKKQFEMDKMLVEMIDAVSQSAPLPAGQGTRVDKSA